MKWMFWISAAVIAYTYVGYVVWLRLRLAWRRDAVMRAPVTPSVSIVLVVRNEERNLEKKIQNLLAVDYPKDRCQIVVVSDGSADRTEAILREYASNPRVHAVMNSLPAGKAAGLNDAMSRAQGEVVVFTDARQQLETGALRLLMENLADANVGCVSGELMLGHPASG